MANAAATSPASRLLRAYANHRYAILFYSLLLTLVGNPLLITLGLTTNLLQVFLALNLLTAVLGVPSGRWRGILLLLAAAVIALGSPGREAGGTLYEVALAGGSAIALVAAGSAVRFADRATEIEAEHLYAALSAYLLAGAIFGVLHWSVELAWPGSYANIGDNTGGAPMGSALYFSFVTLATLGYGDIVPRLPLARGLAVIEAVGGQLYLAVLIARLVGAYMHSRIRPPR
jgi:hypothetical protein